MNETALSVALRTILQLLVLLPTVIPMVEKAINTFKTKIANGESPTTDDINKAIEGVKAQSEEIQKL